MRAPKVAVALLLFYRLFVVSASLLLSGVPACAQEHGGKRGDAHAAARARVTEFIELVNTGSRTAARAYVERSFTDAFRAFAPTEQHLNIFAQLHAQNGALRVEQISVVSPARAEVLLQSELTGGWLMARIDVEPKAPNRIDRIQFGPAPTPPGIARSLPRTDAARVQHLDSLVQRMANADAFSGVVLLARHGVPLFTAAYGEADRATGRLNNLDTRFNLASMNKMVTAVAIAQLVEAGKLSFDDPLSRFLPDFPTPEAARKIRIAHLLSHTSGLGDYLRQLDSSCARTVDEMLALVRDRSTAFEPGTRWRYSNTGYLVLGRVVEEVTGRSYYDYVRENVYVRAGMSRTDAYETDRLPANTAIGYARDYEAGPGAYVSNTSALGCRGGPAGGGFSTAPDLLRFAEALRTGQLVSPTMLRTLTTPKPELGSPEYGFGFTVDEARGIAGHSGGFRGVTANLDLFLEDGYTAVVLSNRDMSGFPIVERMRDLLRGARSAEQAP